MKLNVGDKVGRLTVLDVYKINVNGKNRYYCKCKCDCGNIVDVRMDSISLEKRKTRSCGCYAKENSSILKSTHKHTHSITYKSWFSMKQRCYNPKNPSYKHYGKRGIYVCDRWIHSFENFLEDMGERPSLSYSLDRIDSNGIYEPSNCKWSTMKEQQNNKTNNVRITIDGNEYSFQELAEIYGTNEHRIRQWKQRGLNVQERLKKLKNQNN